MPREGSDQGQALQRVKVGMTGLAGVVVLIGLASAVSAAIHRGDHAPSIAAASNSSLGNTSEPLAEIGAAPGATDSEPQNRQLAAH